MTKYSGYSFQDLEAIYQYWKTI